GRRLDGWYCTDRHRYVGGPCQSQTPDQPPTIVERGTEYRRPECPGRVHRDCGWSCRSGQSTLLVRARRLVRAERCRLPGQAATTRRCGCQFLAAGHRGGAVVLAWPSPGLLYLFEQRAICPSAERGCGLSAIGVL